jgi:hypothetical protein
MQHEAEFKFQFSAAIRPPEVEQKNRTSPVNYEPTQTRMQLKLLGYLLPPSLKLHNFDFWRRIYVAMETPIAALNNGVQMFKTDR